MRAPVPSEPNYTFPTYQVPQVSAMRGSAPPVQVARAPRAVGAEPPHVSPGVPETDAFTVISGSSCPAGNSNLRMQSVTDNCLLNSVTVPKIQRNVAHNNSDKLACKSGALLLLGQDIPGNQKADKILPGLTITQYLDHHVDDDPTTTTNISAVSAGSAVMPPQQPLHAHIAPQGAPAARSGRATDTTSSSYYTFERLVALSKWTRALQLSAVPLPAMRLLGGGESSINTGTSGWGTPPSQQASNNNANTSSGWGTANPANQNNTGTQQWNNNSNRPPNAGPGNTNQDANKANSNLPTNGQPPNGSQGVSGWVSNQKTQQQPPQQSQVGGGGAGSNNPATSNANTSNQSNSSQGQSAGNSTKQQLEQLSNMREAIFSQDGWGGQYVNQDTNWDIPESPEPVMKMDGATSSGPPWKPTVNNGTELWEANLRNGGQPPPPPQQKTPWGHTPSTNIGGTWGEDDDVSESSNVWTALPKVVPPAQQQQWGGNAGANNAGNTGAAMWGGAKKENEWSASAPGGSNWGDPHNADPRAPPMDHRDIRSDPRDMRSGNNDPIRIVDPQQIRLPIGDMRGDLRGITGRLNGTAAEGFWTPGGPPAPSHHMHHQGKMSVGPGGNGGAGWEEPSPPSQRRNMPNYDDGTALWGNPQQGSHWKDLPTGGGGASAMPRGAVNVNGPPGMAPNARPGIKPPMAGDGGSVWRSNGGSWNEEQGPTGSWSEDVSQYSKLKAMGGGGGATLWGENDMDWSHKQGPKQPISKEAIWNSKQFRMLVDSGYKKEDVENALRVRDMSMEDAIDLLNTRMNSNMNWGRHDDHYEHQQFAGQRSSFPSGPSAQVNFPPGSGTPNLLNNMGSSSGTNNSLINNMSPAIVQKMLSQVGGGSQGFGSGGSGGGGGRPLQMTSNPSTAQLRMLVQQIQMAVQAGYLNQQILNQPLAPQTLVLLNQLLQQIKQLQQLIQQQTITQNQGLGRSNSSMLQNLSVYITKTKQQIGNLQNQIASQQANYVKQQTMRGGDTGDIFKSNAMPEINALQSNFSDLGIKDTQSQQQSRLTQWKLPALDKEEGSEFSRAPGSASKPLVPSHSSPNLNPLGLCQSNGPWSSGRGRGDSGWPDSTPGENNAIKDAQWPTDLVPEFEPGKPWKGNQKSIEDDPSITPGSVVRSPLSLPTLPAMKDSELFNLPSSKSPPAGDIAIQPSTFSLSSSTWSYPSSSSSVFTSPQNKVPTSKGVLSALTPTTAAPNSELWGAPKSGPPPPPGLSTKGGNSAVNGWSGNIGSCSSSTAWQRNNWSPSQWLLLRNLTAQIDGSTLRTLCMQHGPLENFHLFLHQGFALAKYQSNEEAAKAQAALNNCVLGNTTILAENPSDWEANAHLQQVSNTQGGSGGAWRGSGNQQPQQQQQTHTDMWSTGWSNPPSASLWQPTPLDSAEQSRGTPSNLQSFLPGDLLGGGRRR